MGETPKLVMDFEAAVKVVLEHAAGVQPGGVETVPLLESLGRVLAAEVRAERDQPPFDRSTRDGFALRCEDAAGELRVVGQVRAGEVWTGAEVGRGEAVEIMTGAPIPAGADAVVMVEHVVREGERLRVLDGRRLEAGENVVAQGSEARAGQAVVAAGTGIGAAEIALAAACGCAELAVYGRPTVAIVATGDELVELREIPGPQQIRNSNSYAIKAMVTEAGGDGERLAIARDVRKEVWDRVTQGRRSDLLVFSGGVSMGEYDLVEEVLAEFGAEFFFTGVRMQPGKPVVFGRLPEREGERSCYFFGLPGNPVSTQVTFHCFVEPLLRAMGGGEVAGPRLVQATLMEDAEGKAGLTRLLPARMSVEGLRAQVRLVGWQGSGDLAANARANCYAVLEAGRDRVAGDVIPVLLR